MKKTALALIVSIALLGAACSSNTSIDAEVADGEAASASSVTTRPQDSDENGLATSTANADVATDIDLQETADESTPVRASPAVAPLGNDWCAVAAEVENSFADEVLNPLSDADSLQQAFEQSTQLINAAVEIAPAEISADVADMAVGFTAMTGLLADADWEFLSIDVAQLEVATFEMEDAGYNIQKYNFEVCGLGTDPDGAIDEAPLEDVSLDALLDSDLARSVMADTLAGMGFSGEEADCVVEAWSAAGGLDNTSGMLEGMTACDVPFERLSGG